MKSKLIGALIALNLLLLIGLFARVNQPATAQVAPNARPSEYLMIPADVIGGSNGVVWIIDSRNQMLSGITLDRQGRGLEMMAPLELNRVFNRGGNVGR